MSASRNEKVAGSGNQLPTTSWIPQAERLFPRPGVNIPSPNLFRPIQDGPRPQAPAAEMARWRTGPTGVNFLEQRYTWSGTT
jgi:hypothetical protein